ncbi:unnamed protein product [Closterium sp. Naga37s-1]|nr:unnamed protein product [Closterium sp. Naga37s-1]
MPRLLASPHLAASHAASPRFPPSRVFQSRASNASGGCLGGKWAETLTLRRDISSGGDWGNRGRQGSVESYAGRSWGEGRSRRRGVCCSTGTGGKGFGGGQGTGESAGGAKGSSAAKKDEKKQESGAFGGLDWREVARPALPMLDLSKPRGQGRVARGGASRWHQEKPKVHPPTSLSRSTCLVHMFMSAGPLPPTFTHTIPVSHLQPTFCSRRGGRARDVWMVMEPAFLDHPSLASLRAAIRPPTAAIVSTNGDWMLTIVHEMLPQATIGKFYAPTPQLPDPLKSKLTPGDVALGGGGIWH